MQIDTHNRDVNGTKFVAGPEPKASCAPKDAIYSGVLECPCTDRITKEKRTQYSTSLKGECSTPITTAQECYDAVAGILKGKDQTNNTVNTASMPTGCSFANDKDQGFATFNSMTTGTAACGSGDESKMYLGAGTTPIGVNVDV